MLKSLRGTGRFINADDVEVATSLGSTTINGLNFYSYCQNNPINLVDNSGMWPVPNIAPQVGIVMGFLKDLLAGFGGAALAASSKAFSAAAKIPMYAGGVKGAWGSMGAGGAGATLNPSYLKAMDSATNLQAGGKFMSAAGKVAKVLGYAALIADCVLSVHNNFTNPNLSTSRKVTDSIVDVGFSVGSFALASLAGVKLGALVGSFFGPGIGTVVGAVIGAGIGLAVYFFQQTQLYQDIKVGFNTFVTQTVPNALNDFVSGWNSFWSFSWAR